MNILKQKLASVSPGSHVRITQQNGNVLDGTVLENDGTESLSVRVSLTAFLSYDGIAGIETSDSGDIPAAELPKTASVSETPDAPPQKTKEEPPAAPKTAALFPPGNPVNIQKIKTTRLNAKAALDNMVNDKMKKDSRPFSDKFQSHLKSRDPSKLREVVARTKNLMDENEWWYDADYNLFYAWIVLEDKDFLSAAVSFFYAKHSLYAARAAYYGAAESKNDELYDIAGAAAVLVLLDKDASADYDEAAEILKQCAAKRMDISFVPRLLESGSNLQKQYLSRILWYLCGCCEIPLTNPEHIDESLEKLDPYYNQSGIRTELSRLLGENTELEEDFEEYDMEELYDQYDTKEPENTEPPVNISKPLSSKTFEGYIISFQSSGDGLLRGSSGKTYPFTETAVREADLLEKLRADAGKAAFPYIPAEFVVTKNDDKESVSSVKYKKIYGTSAPFVEASPYSGKVHALMEAKKYDEIYPIGEELIDSGNIDDGCYYLFQAYLAALKQNPSDATIRNAMERLADRYAADITVNIKNTELLRQVYQRLNRIHEQLEALNRMIELTPSDEYSRILNFYALKAECYTEIKDYPSAIAQLEVYQDILQKAPATFSNGKTIQSHNNKIAELYLLMEDWENAKKYAEKLVEEQKQAILSKIPGYVGDDDDDDNDDDSSDNTGNDDGDNVGNDAPVVPLSEYYEDYLSAENFCLPQDEAGIFAGIADFPKDRLYALLTWLTTLSDLADRSEDGQRVSQFSENHTAAETIAAAEQLFSAAFRNPLSYRKDFAADLPALFECAGKCIPEIADGLFAAASLRALFHYSQDVALYQYDDLWEIALENDALTERFPQLPVLLDTMLDFHKQTGCGVNFFAKYRTNHDVLERMVADAQKRTDEIVNRLDSHENMGRVRKTREILFGDPDGILRVGLDIVLKNRIASAPELKEMITDEFIRSGKPFSFDNVDVKKLDKFIDNAWEDAKRELKREGYSVSNPNDNLVGSRLTNITMSIRRILECLCGWVEAAENSAEAENPTAKKLLDEITPTLEQHLHAILDSCKDSADWGTEAVRYVVTELLAKLDGSFDTGSGKYFFLGFLRDGNVLLDEDYLPARNSTFCDLPAFTLPERIRRHALSPLPTLEERLGEIFEDDAAKNNLRSAQLIHTYGEETDNPVLSGHKAFRNYNKCTVSGKRRLEAQFEDFAAELELFEQYGSLSDIAGEKTRILHNITTWYRICDRTCDYGFYISILNAYRETIAAAAQNQGEQLLRQLEELERDSSYDFGVYPPERIRSYIEDKNFIVAENMLNCVRRHDVSEISDYAEEAFGYINGFISEAGINYRAVSDMNKSIEHSLLKYTQKKDLEKAFRQFGGTTAMKDIKGGISLITNWIYSSGDSPEKVAKILSLLGMPDCTLRKEEAVHRSSYLAKLPLRTGKVTYAHPIPAFGSFAEQEEFRILCLYGSHDCGRLLDEFRKVNTTAKHTLVFLDFPLNIEERRKLARKLKEEKSFAKTFLVIDRVLLFYLARHYAANTVSRMLMAAAMPFAYYQPFVEDSRNIMPPELFTGREDALVAIEQPDGVNLVYGGRQLGKSALLKMAKHNIDGNANGDRAVLVEIKDRSYPEAAKDVSYRLIVDGILPEGSETDDWEVLTRRLEARLRSDSPTKINYLLIMLDEADEFIKSCQEVNHRPIALLKNLMPGHFKIVMAGLHDLSRFNRDIALHGNSLLAHLTAINVKPFERPEAVKLLTHTLSYLGLRFKEESFISLILAKTNYFPGLIQLYCQKLLETMRNSDYAGYGQFNTPPYEITESHFKKVLTDRDFAAKIHEKLEMTLFTEEKEHSHYHIIALLLSYLQTTQPNENGYTSEEIYGFAVSQEIKRITKLKHEQLHELMNEMWDLNILTAKNDRYVFATEGFREMLGSQTAVEAKIAEYKEEDPA